MTVSPNLTLDLKGKVCPDPINDTAVALRDLAEGEVLEVFATDPGAAEDFPVFCHMTRHELLASELNDGVFRFLIRRG